jgi:hypothetical protein
MTIGDVLVEDGGDASGTISGISTGTSQITVGNSDGVWTIGSIAKGTSVLLPAPAPTTEPPDPNFYDPVAGSPFISSSAPFTTRNVPASSLDSSTRYYARVQYKTTGTQPATSSFSGWSSFETSNFVPPAAGAALGGGYFAGQIRDGSTIYNLIVAPVTSGSLFGQFGGSPAGTIQWKSTATADVNPAASNEVYGAPATTTFGAIGAATYPMFGWCYSGATGPNAGTYDATNATGTGIGGFNDWYIPAKNELAVAYFYLKTNTTANSTTGSNPNSVAPYTPNTPYGPGFPSQTTSTLFQTGGAQAFTLGILYYTATQQSATPTSAWMQEFTTGNQGQDGDKTVSRYARAVRRVSA